MTNLIPTLGFPQWLMIAGAILLLLGIVGLSMRRDGNEAEPDAVAREPEILKLESDQAEGEINLLPVKQKRRDRWADRELAMKEAAEVGPEFYGKRSG